ncbi:tRNA (adenosine(37)-N6)-threonylcarbamoyltransferase complex dimerization subunit type 1 TsaB [Nonlabens ponticola]|uniref:N(6)-L-threonylcarbamoyladenine synthase n=1 Tax=Nonlabens ponticola TaxID=2496866 RepID=A0A3S9MVR4_9FLAO|nr:tRNA (adenosine(37)-N6)-threonylcarbamoyltransferase complex dimerization subunit type 1 TsaB [Nonlabens ponticola]AZQ43316.1 tRNA (adenosine(37)-N6)-threonylcarbamoyltransferase complex dimerization subunit type 1 TsaB [Nonlabens ponticola]
MKPILCIETTSTNCSVALAVEGSLLPNNYGLKDCLDLLEDNSDNYQHGERLHIFIDEILKRNSIDRSDLTAVAISSGPGSYTGLRIGTAAAKGLCYALDIPLISIDTVNSLSVMLEPDQQASYVVPMIDARRMEVYTAVFQDHNLITPVNAMILDTNSYQDIRKGKDAVFIGSGATKFREFLQDNTNKYIDRLPSAIGMCSLAMAAHKKSDFVKEVAYYEPLYLKEFKAG